MKTTTVAASETHKTHLPLTTTFTAPDSCISNLWLGSTSGKTWMNLGPISHAECLPSGWEKTGYYSPGICPTGYGVAHRGTVIDGSLTETAATCCPTLDGHTYETRPAESSTISESIDCIWSPGGDLTTQFTYTWTDDDGSTSSAETALSSSDHINAYGVYIRWQASNSSTPPASTPVSNTATTTTAAATATSSETPTDSSSSSGLSTGAKAGIGVGVAVGAVLAIIALVLFFIRRRNNRPGQYQQSPDDAGSMGLQYQTPREMPTEYSQGSPNDFAELPVPTNVPELEGSRK